MAMKYIMLKLDSGDLVPLIFPEFVQHSHMAQLLPATVVGAGRVFLEGGQLVTRGGSSSLAVCSREQDGEIINGYFGGNLIQREC